MGHQLWSSPTTGHRRNGTRLTELYSLLDRSITAGSIAERLKCCPADMYAEEAKQLLRRRSFDIAGVMQTENDLVRGWVDVEELKHGKVEDHAKDFESSSLIVESSSISDVIAMLSEQRHFFVVIGSGLKGIVTRADLNKPPVRMYLFSLISVLEMHLAFWIKKKYCEQDIEKNLTADRMKTAQEFRDSQKALGQELDTIECLQMCDKRDLIVNDKELRYYLNMGSKTNSQSTLRRITDLRDKLAHNHHSLANEDSWKDKIEDLEWTRNFLQISDAKIEEEANKNARSFNEKLLMTA